MLATLFYLCNTAYTRIVWVSSISSDR